MHSLNLHINYTCPLNCKYCVQREDPNLLKYSMPLEEMIRKVQNFLDVNHLERCSVNISGGEPLLRYDDIKKLIEHFPQNLWEISTSGYLLDEEKAKFFGQHGVYYILSIDGTERVTNYLRPLANGKTGYFKQLKENLPALFYYSPKVRAKLIVPQRFISELFSTYLELERLGFNEIFITPNVYENTVSTDHPELETGSWRISDWENFEQQIQKINNEIKLGISINKKRCIISNVIHPAMKMVYKDSPSNKTINLNKMICPVLEFKGGSSPEGGQVYDFENCPISICIFHNPLGLKTQEELIQRAQNDFQKLNGICPKDEECPYQSTCVYSLCLSQTIRGQANENIWVPSDFDCITQKIYHNAALDFLNTLNNNNNDVTNYYWDIINKMGERALDDGLEYFLSLSNGC